jgi:hypothetical protein
MTDPTKIVSCLDDLIEIFGTSDLPVLAEILSEATEVDVDISIDATSATLWVDVPDTGIGLDFPFTTSALWGAIHELDAFQQRRWEWESVQQDVRDIEGVWLELAEPLDTSEWAAIAPLPPYPFRRPLKGGATVAQLRQGRLDPYSVLRFIVERPDGGRYNGAKTLQRIRAERAEWSPPTRRQRELPERHPRKQRKQRGSLA